MISITNINKNRTLKCLIDGRGWNFQNFLIRGGGGGGLNYGGVV